MKTSKTMPHVMLQNVWYLWKESLIDIHKAIQIYSHFGYKLNYITKRSVEIQGQEEIYKFKSNLGMHTPINTLIEVEESLTQMFDSDQRVAMALLEYVRNNKKELRKEARQLITQTVEDAQKPNFWEKYGGIENYYKVNFEKQ